MNRIDAGSASNVGWCTLAVLTLGCFDNTHAGVGPRALVQGLTTLKIEDPVCRSAYVSRRLAHLLEGTGVTVTSAGTEARVERGMDAAAAARLARAGGEARGFAAKQLTPEMVAEADLVLTATRRLRAQVAQLHYPAVRYCFSVGDFADLVGGLQEEQQLGENVWRGDSGGFVRPRLARTHPGPDELGIAGGADVVRHHENGSAVARVAALAAERRGFLAPRKRTEVNLPEISGPASTWRMTWRAERMLPSVAAALTPPSPNWAQLTVLDLAGPSR